MSVVRLREVSSYKEFSYSKMTEERPGPTEGFRLIEVSVKVAVDTLTMNIFIRQDIGKGITFKFLISRTLQSRFCQNLP